MSDDRGSAAWLSSLGIAVIGPAVPDSAEGGAKVDPDDILLPSGRRRSHPAASFHAIDHTSPSRHRLSCSTPRSPASVSGHRVPACERLDRLATLDPGVPGRDGGIDRCCCRRCDRGRAHGERFAARRATQPDTKFGARDENAVSPAAIQRPRPANIAIAAQRSATRSLSPRGSTRPQTTPSRATATTRR